MHGDATEPMAAFGEFILTLNMAIGVRGVIFDCNKKYIIRNKKLYALSVHLKTRQPELLAPFGPHISPMLMGGASVNMHLPKGVIFDLCGY